MCIHGCKDELEEDSSLETKLFDDEGSLWQNILSLFRGGAAKSQPSGAENSVGDGDGDGDAFTGREAQRARQMRRSFDAVVDEGPEGVGRQREPDLSRQRRKEEEGEDGLGSMLEALQASGAANPALDNLLQQLQQQQRDEDASGT